MDIHFTLILTDGYSLYSQIELTVLIFINGYSLYSHTVFILTNRMIFTLILTKFYSHTHKVLLSFSQVQRTHKLILTVLIYSQLD